MNTISTPALCERFAHLIGESHVLTAADDTASYLTDWRGRYRGAARCVLRPGSPEEVAAIVRLCAEEAVPIVPQGGNTGLCGGATPDAAGQSAGQSVVLSLSRLTRIRAVDAANRTLVADAGCTLAAIQEAAAAAACLFPLSLASEGSCQLGGILSTNAGGVQVLRYGNMRDLTLGLEVVLPNGALWSALRGLRKDNTGYDLKQLFIGAEGTLGVITGAVVKLFPRPAIEATAWLTVDTPGQAVELLARAQAAFDARLTAFELISATALELVLRHLPGARLPVAAAPWQVLMELSDCDPAQPLQGALENWLAARAEEGVLIDAVCATSLAQSRQLWALREGISEAQKIEGVSIKHDISLPVSRIPDFLAETDPLLANDLPGLRIVTFGHVGDGNLHYNLSKPLQQENARFLARQEEIHCRVHAAVLAHGGSISAEHGIGQLKREALQCAKSPTEMALMRAIKATIDPQGLMNPGKIL